MLLARRPGTRSDVRSQRGPARAIGVIRHTGFYNRSVYVEAETSVSPIRSPRVTIWGAQRKPGLRVATAIGVQMPSTSRTGSVGRGGLCIRALVASLALGGLVVTGQAAPAGAAPAAGPALPSHDAFYRYTGKTPLRAIKPGTVLKSRPVTIVLGPLPLPFVAEQVLYRSTGEIKGPTAVVATIIRPLLPLAEKTKIISYQMAYDTLGPQCDSSYLLRGGNPSYALNGDPEIPIIATFVAAGYTVVVPDYEGTRHAWGAGHESGYGTLDGIRATEKVLRLSRSTPVGMIGYSGGSIATEWAAELAPSYAPSLRILGVAAGGLPVDMWHNIAYIDGSKDWSGILPGIMIGLARGFHFDLDRYLSSFGKKAVAAQRDGCINEFRGAYPGLTFSKLFKPQYRDVSKVPALARIFNTLIMGSAAGHPAAPILLAVGNDDGTGDGVMIARDVEALAHEYCKQGVSVQLHTYTGLDHDTAAIPFLLAAIPFLRTRLNGASTLNRCSSIGPGNTVAPLR